MLLKRIPTLITGSIFGGEQINHEKARLRKGLPLLFITPGRLAYHLKNTKCFVYDKLQVLIFEEADRTLDMGFQKIL